MLLETLVATAALLSAEIQPLPAAATIGAAATTQSTVGSRECAETPPRSTGRRIIGGIGGALAGRLLGSNDVTSRVSSYIPAEQMLTQALISLLDCEEQQKAARATDEVTVQAERSGAGATTSWESETRPGVSGSSTVTAVEDHEGRRCMTVSDVVIIDGEETTVPKRLCRTPPSTRYARV